MNLIHIIQKMPFPVLGWVLVGLSVITTTVGGHALLSAWLLNETEVSSERSLLGYLGRLSPQIGLFSTALGLILGLVVSKEGDVTGLLGFASVPTAVGMLIFLR